MLTSERLKSLAQNAGFEPHTDFDCNEFDLCVVSLPYDADERFEPFNAKTSQFDKAFARHSKLLRDAAMMLSDEGLLFIYGLPAHLAASGVALADLLTFRYCIAIRTATTGKADELRPEHTGLLLLSKPNAPINKIRVPHAVCRACGDTLKDWGGKAHLMNPAGVALSDVWMDFIVDRTDRMPAEVFERILQLAKRESRKRLLLLTPERERVTIYQDVLHFEPFNPLSLTKRETQKEQGISNTLLNQLHKGKCLDILKTIPSQSIDLAFADPPFNLMKDYNGYADELAVKEYIGWCKRWLVEYMRVLKPGGALVILNLPKWALHISDFLCRQRDIYLQNWIVWNALPEPKGVLMPAHYGLLYFTKGKRAARFNYCSMEQGWQPFDEAVFPPDRVDVCKRRSCIRKRRASASLWRGELTDIWHDIHRDRRAGRRATTIQGHPCPTPEALIDRLIRLTTNPGDVVLDAFAGVGTTALVAGRLGRNFICIEQDEKYISTAERRIIERKQPLQKPAKRRKQKIAKSHLQLELKRLSVLLDRLPTQADIEQFSDYKLEAFNQVFTSWGEALKAAKIQLQKNSQQSFNQIESLTLCRIEEERTFASRP